MGLQRIIIDSYTSEEHAVTVAQRAVEMAKQSGCSVSEAKVVHHPGQWDEKTTEVYKA